MRKFFCVIMTLLLSLSIFCACRYYESDTHSSEQPPRTDEDTEPTQKEETPPPGRFYSLENAYEQGFITITDIMNIAYIQNGQKLYEEVNDFTPIPKNPETLSEETVNAIKETEAYSLRNSLLHSEPTATADDIDIDGYYGTYNDFVAIKLTNAFVGYPAVETEEIICGIKFVLGYPNSIIVWKRVDNKNTEPSPPGEFIPLERAYIKHLITKNDLLNIAYIQNGNKLYKETENFSPSPKNPETLNLDTENAIKETQAYMVRTQIFNPHANATKDDVYVDKYLGTYNGYVAVVVLDRFYQYDGRPMANYIDSIRFDNETPMGIYLWKYNK